MDYLQIKYNLIVLWYQHGEGKALKVRAVEDKLTRINETFLKDWESKMCVLKISLTVDEYNSKWQSFFDLFIFLMVSLYF